MIGTNGRTNAPCDEGITDNPIGVRKQSGRVRILFVATHPVQYQAPLFRRFYANPEIDVDVAYCSLRGAELSHDPEFDMQVQWDVPLLSGYRWISVANKGSGSDSFFGLFNTSLWSMIRRGRYDAIISFVGYVRSTFWIGLAAAKLSHAAYIFGADATSLVPRDGAKWKVLVKKILWPRVFGLADQVIVPSSRSRDLMIGLGIPSDRITLTPYAVDNDWWRQESAKVDRKAIRQSWGASPHDVVILFCAKLQPWKRPLDLVRAFAAADLQKALLVFAGEGPLKQAILDEAKALNIDSRIRMLGFVNQSALPGVYTSADLMVLPSEYEPFAVVVNEAMCCSCPVAASDRVGAATDLVAPVNSELVYPCGDIESLSKLLRNALIDRDFLKEIGRRSLAHISTWSPEKNVAATIDAVKAGIYRIRA